MPKGKRRAEGAPRSNPRQAAVPRRCARQHRQRSPMPWFWRMLPAWTLTTRRTNGVSSLLTGGQACVIYGGAEFSRDTDLAVLADPDNLAQVLVPGAADARLSDRAGSRTSRNGVAGDARPTALERRHGRGRSRVGGRFGRGGRERNGAQPRPLGTVAPGARTPQTRAVRQSRTRRSLNRPPERRRRRGCRRERHKKTRVCRAFLLAVPADL